MSKRLPLYAVLMVLGLGLGFLVWGPAAVRSEPQGNSPDRTWPFDHVIVETGKVEILFGQVRLGDSNGNWSVVCEMLGHTRINGFDPRHYTVPVPVKKITASVTEWRHHRTCHQVQVAPPDWAPRRVAAIRSEG